MFISHKSNVIQVIDELDWRCRQRTKGISKSEYWAWLDSVTTDGVADYSGETGYTIVECTDENVPERLKQLEEQVITLSIQLQENLDKDTSADTMFATHKGEQNARWDALNKFMKHQFVVEF